MKSIIKTGLLLFTSIAMLTASCKKEDEDEGKLPNISLKTGTGYTAKDSSVAKTA